MIATSICDDDIAGEGGPPSGGSATPTRRVAVTVVALGVWCALVAVTVVWGRHLLDSGVRLGIGAAPLAGKFGRRVGVDAFYPIGFSAAAIAFGPRFADRCSWRPLLAGGAVAAGLWAVALSRIDGARALTAPFHKTGYLQAARRIDDPHVFLSQFVERIHSYSTHVRGHPPGMEILLWATARIGLEGVGRNVFLAVAGGAVAAVAALVALREVAGEHTARAALPFVVLAPGAIWWSSGDPFFAGISVCAVAFVIVATGRDGCVSDRLAIFGGLLLGVTTFLSYGLVLVACIPIGVGVHRRRLRPLAVAALGAVPVFVAFRLAGFSWVAGLAATRTQYWLGAAHHRPFSYFVVADIAAFALAVGPAAAVALARLRDRRVWLLVGSALVAVIAADLSAMSKAEVERIWLPFVPWVLLATAVFADGHRRRSLRFWLGLQLAGAVLIEMTVRSPW